MKKPTVKDISNWLLEIHRDITATTIETDIVYINHEICEHPENYPEKYPKFQKLYQKYCSLKQNFPLILVDEYSIEALKILAEMSGSLKPFKNWYEATNSVRKIFTNPDILKSFERLRNYRIKNQIDSVEIPPALVEAMINIGKR